VNRGLALRAPGPELLAARRNTIPKNPVDPYHYSMPFSPITYLRMLRDDRRRYGFRGLIQRHGWKPFAVFFVAYLVRDLILYVALPLAAYFGVFKG